jgi:putative oxidoreductase
VQRLFSTFADGSPGAGLLLLRLLTAGGLVYFGIEDIRNGPASLTIGLEGAGIAAGIFLAIGLFTPLAGTVAAIAQFGIAIARFPSDTCNLWISLAQVILAVALVMIGPGAYSIDARRFGRKHFDLSDQ